jgi:flagellar L-ring protein FlgH
MKIKNKILFVLVMVHGLSFADSLYMSSDPVTSSMFSDKRARNIGDIITIYISEATNSAQKGATNLKKTSTFVQKITSLFFPAAAAPTSKTDTLYQGAEYLGSRIGTHRGTLPSSNWSSSDDFKGQGDLSSSNTVTGTITAMIIEVMPNGNFIVEGNRKVSVDGQERNIIISGIVRPEDIGADNSILSRNLANAKIEFADKGILSNSRKVGLLKKIWDFIGF